MKESKQTLSFKLITEETRDDVYHEALDYATDQEPYLARDRQFALAYYNDAPAGCGGGSRMVEWFQAEKELLEHIPSFLLVMNLGPRECEKLSKDLATVVTAYWDNKISRDGAMALINDLASDFFQVEWWGTREQLLTCDERFPTWLRSSWRGSDDTSPLRDDEREDFFEYLSCDYMC